MIDCFLNTVSRHVQISEEEILTVNEEAIEIDLAPTVLSNRADDELRHHDIRNKSQQDKQAHDIRALF